MSWVVVAIVARLGIGAILVAAGVSKALMGHVSTARLINSYRLAPKALLPGLAIALPTLEITVGVALLLGVWLPVTDWVAIVLIAGLTIIAAITAARGLTPNCGCFGKAFETAISPLVISRNVLFVLVLGFVLWADEPMPATVDSAGVSPLLTAPAVMALAVAAAMLMFRRTSHGT
ncbi:MAG TPA: MauE/DoxX family redox-associated membrane protein [Candidatus Dormibacteraeota bacterium]